MSQGIDAQLEKTIEQYREIIGQDSTDEIMELADELKGISSLHINSTRIGGGVAEILQNLVPLADSMGLSMKWQVLEGSPEFFEVTKSFHNGLQGMDLPLTESMKETYLRFNKEFADRADFDSDILFIHDPQPAPLIQMVEKDRKKIAWRCHIDLTNANLNYWNFIKKFIIQYDALIFSLDKYVRKDARMNRIYLVPPSIDPLSDKNKSLSHEIILDTLKKFDINPKRPIVTQISRFDYWKNPLGVIECYKLIKRKIPETQLVLIGNMADDDPEGGEWYEKILKKAEEAESIHILLNLEDIEVNSFQRASNVIIQNSIREGFGLTITEALWKRTPVIGTRVGGIPLQVIDSVTGFLIKSIQEAADRTIQILKDKSLERTLGIQGKEHVKENFLITRHLKDYLKIQQELIENPGSNIS